MCFFSARVSLFFNRHSFSERSKFIPVRLTTDERRYLRLVESVISVTDYTGKVDADFPSASKRQNLILKQVSTTSYASDMPTVPVVLYPES